MAHVSCCVLLAGSMACATGVTSSVRGRSSLADGLFASGAYAEAIEAYGRELDDVRTPDERARLRLFRALALLAQEEARAEADAITELRDLELRHGTAIWGRLARIHVLELTRRDALREAIMQAGVQLQETEHERKRLEHRLLAVQALGEDQQQTVVSLEDERKKLRRELDTVREQAEDQSARIRELERELEALKQIDLRADP
jgi:chromosome segregation ATPase